MSDNFDDLPDFLEQWKAIKDVKGTSAETQRRLSLDLDFFIAVTHPENVPSLLLVTDVEIAASKEDLISSTQVEILVEKTPDNRNAVRLQLNDKKYEEVFLKVASDIAPKVNQTDIPEEAVTILLRRFRTWRQFLKSERSKGLGLSMQLGLYGELKTLEFLLESGIDKVSAVAAWTGPEEEEQDFQLNGIAIETKSVVHSEPQKLKINGERQLDEDPFSALVISHHRVHRQQDAGETLPEAVAELENLLSDDTNALELFDEKLVLYGYKAVEETEYLKHGYAIRDTKYYRVHAGFPCLTESNLPAGVGRLTYVIDASACEKYTYEAETIIAWLKDPESALEGELPEESGTIEYKATAWTPVGEKITGEEERKGMEAKLKTGIVQTVVGFLNTEGGQLLIGVDDNQSVTGIEVDLLSKDKEESDIDHYQLAIQELLQRHINDRVFAYLKFEFDKRENGTICAIRVRPSPSPMMGRPVSGSGNEKKPNFWVRRGNATITLEGDDLLKYIMEKY